MPVKKATKNVAKKKPVKKVSKKKPAKKQAKKKPVKKVAKKKSVKKSPKKTTVKKSSKKVYSKKPKLSKAEKETMFLPLTEDDKKKNCSQYNGKSKDCRQNGCWYDYDDQTCEPRRRRR